MILVLVGESGAGKSVLEKEFAKKGFNKIISYTNRKIRYGEEQDVDYHFVTEDTFKLDKDTFAETETYSFNRIYGSKKADYLGKEDKVAVLTPNGLRQLKKALPEAKIYSVYVTAPLDQRVKRYINRCKDFSQADMNEINSRTERDWGMFRGIENEVNLVIHNTDDTPINDSVETILQFMRINKEATGC